MIASRLTPGGRGAVATIRLVGDLANPALRQIVSPLNLLFRAINNIVLSEQPLGKISFGEWGDVDPEELVVCRVDPRTIEIHCHGGEAAVQRILADLSAAGCETVDWRTSRVVSQDLLDVECLQVLSQTSTWKTTRIVLEQSQGLLKSAFRRLQDAAVVNNQEFEHATGELLKWASFGLHLSKPWKIVLTGRPNVGKSSLINALLGYQRAIVFDEPGTTRDVVTAETAFEGWPVLLTDTAGIREDANSLEAAGIASARKQLATADLRLVLIDASQSMTDEDVRLLTQWPDALVVAHKSDLPNRWNGKIPEAALPVSSVTREGIVNLQERMIQRLIPTAPDRGTPIVLTKRQIDALQKAQAAPNCDERLQALADLIEPSMLTWDQGDALG